MTEEEEIAEQWQIEAERVLNRVVLRLPEGINSPGAHMFVEAVIQAATLRAVASMTKLIDNTRMHSPRPLGDEG